MASYASLSQFVRNVDGGVIGGSHYSSQNQSLFYFLGWKRLAAAHDDDGSTIARDDDVCGLKQYHQSVLPDGT